VPSIDEYGRRAVDFCQRLVRIPSLSGSEAQVAQAIAGEMQLLGYDAIEIDSMGSVIGTIDSGVPGRTVIFDGHVDTVGVTDQADWTRDPFGGEIEGGRLYGRGASDMKGSLAAMIYGAALSAKTVEAGTVYVCGTVMEELFEGAALAAIVGACNPDCVVVGESTGLCLNLGQRGRMEIVVETSGLAAHSSTPHLGVNAVEKMTDVLVRLRSLPMPHDDLLGSGVLVLTDIISSPYPAISVVPHRCRATFDRRFLVGEDPGSVLDPMRHAIAGLQAADPILSAQVSIARGEYKTYTGRTISGEKVLSAWKTPADGLVAVTAREALKAAGIEPREKAYSFCTNGSGSARLGVTTIGFGAGFEEQAHTRDEYIEVDQIEKATAGFASLAQYLTRSGRQMRLF